VNLQVKGVVDCTQVTSKLAAGSSDQQEEDEDVPFRLGFGISNPDESWSSSSNNAVRSEMIILILRKVAHILNILYFELEAKTKLFSCLQKIK
jgi:hypothetical protein